MVIKLKKNNLIDGSLLAIMFMQLTILEFFGWGRIITKFLAIALIVRMIIWPHKKKTNIGKVLVTLLLMFALNLVFTSLGSANVIKTNFFVIYYPYIYICYVWFLCKERPDFMNSIAREIFVPLNLVMIINIVVLILQIIYPNMISAKIMTKEIDYYEDTISGLFEYGSTHIVCLFTTAVVLYNFSFVKKIKGKVVRKLILLLNILIMIFAFGISTFNDNKAIFVILPIALLLYWLSQVSNSYKRVAIITFIFLTIALLCILSKNFYTFFNDNVINLYKMSAEALNLGSSAKGSNERIAIILFALSKTSTWLCGTGFGNSVLYAEGYQGFEHFGQADLGSMLILGGVAFTVVLIYLYIGMLDTIATNNKRNRVVGLGITCIFILSIVYTQSITKTNSISCLILIALAYRNALSDT